MSKLNSLGLELMELKKAIASNYPAIVLRSLNQTADDLLKNELIDQETHYLLAEPVFAANDFKEFCLTKENLCKSSEELLALYEEKRVRLEVAFSEVKGFSDLSIENYIDDEQIIVVKSYRFGTEQVRQYFGIIDDEDCVALMKRKGFVERFVALRYPKILKEFISKKGLGHALFRVAQSGVFHDQEKEDYAIELLFKIEVQTLEEIDAVEFVEPVSQLIEECNNWFNSHLGVDGLFYGERTLPVLVSSTSSRQAFEESVERPKTSNNSLSSLEETQKQEINDFALEQDALPSISEVDLDLEIEIPDFEIESDGFLI